MDSDPWTEELGSRPPADPKRPLVIGAGLLAVGIASLVRAFSTFPNWPQRGPGGGVGTDSMAPVFFMLGLMAVVGAIAMFVRWYQRR